MSSVKVKHKIRSLEKLLLKDTLPADVRVDKERALAAQKAELRSILHNRRTQERAKKYHMLRFFERKKAVRRLKQAVRAVAEAEKAGEKKDIKKAKRVLHHAQIDVAYVYMFPKADKYIALFPHAPTDEQLKDDNVKRGLQITNEKRLEFKRHVEALIDAGTLPFTFEDVLAEKTIQVETKARLRPETEAEAKAEVEAEEDDFFE